MSAPPSTTDDNGLMCSVETVALKLPAAVGGLQLEINANVTVSSSREDQGNGVAGLVVSLIEDGGKSGVDRVVAETLPVVGDSARHVSCQSSQSSSAEAEEGGSHCWLWHALIY